MEARYDLSEILFQPPPQFNGLYVLTNFKAPQVAPGTNTCSISWRDLDILLEERSLFLIDGSDTRVDPGPLILYLKSLKSEKANNGASIRYAIAASPENRIRLEVQALPGQAKSLNSKANIRGDNVVSVLLGQFPVNADLYGGTNLAGPVPLFFAQNPAGTLTILNKTRTSSDTTTALSTARYYTWRT